MKKKDRYLKLRQESWENLFHVLHELGLGRMERGREEVYFKEYGMHFSMGNFWACVQSLEAQLEQEE